MSNHHKADVHLDPATVNNWIEEALDAHKSAWLAKACWLSEAERAAERSKLEQCSKVEH